MPYVSGVFLVLLFYSKVSPAPASDSTPHYYNYIYETYSQYSNQNVMSKNSNGTGLSLIVKWWKVLRELVDKMTS
jgi:hypothetical protein